MARVEGGFSARHGELQFARVEVTNTQLMALRATAATIVPAPGNGYVLEFVSAQLYLQAPTVAITESADNMAFKYDSGSGTTCSETVECTGFIDQTADTMTNAIAVKDTIVAASSCNNKAIVLHQTGNGEWGGNTSNDAKLIVDCTYRVHVHGW